MKKKCEMVLAEETHTYHGIREKLHHPGRVLNLKAKDLIGPEQTLLFSSQSNARIL